MKMLIKTYFSNAILLLGVSEFFPGMSFNGGIKTFLSASLALALSTLIVKPIINVMILPLNLVTFGFFRWISSFVALYLVTLVVPDFMISSFSFKGFESLWFDLPAVNVAGFFAIILYSLLISIGNTFLHWLLK